MKDLKIKHLNAVVSEINPDYLVAYASVEMVDVENDLIRIDGMDLSYHTSDSPIKIFPDHTYVAPDAYPTVIGRVEMLEKTYYKNTDTPALKFKMSWAKNPDGNFTNLAKAYKDLYTANPPYLDSFSIGVERIEGKRFLVELLIGLKQG